ncbi:MAG: glycosyltransferase family 61 protein [Okeania sp. SIO3B5]|uniref:glycosyltransferase family 61 protein n=1 Tax=Okeania sp. SIO3B5 TaxID=2607811 RepID=UPI001400BA89|nr:glycosyltransferase family 61 protein [Okeania sp. SIO3B5]NEO54927.1 glycosyltransferase family 61 protein [Okeania sp. SIO3B5]
MDTYNKEIEHYINALLIKPGIDKICYELGKILEQSGQIEDAQICYQRNVPVHLIEQYAQSNKSWTILDTLSENSNSDRDFRYEMVYLGEELPLLPAKGLSKNLHPNFQKTNVLAKDMLVYFLPNGRGWANKNASAVLTQSNCLLQTLSTGVCNTVAASNHLPNVHQLEGNVVFLSSRWGSRAYFHWIIDVLPRFQLLRKVGFCWDDISYFVLHNPTTTFNQEALKILEIPPEKIIDSSDIPHIQAEQLIVPSIIGEGRGQDRDVQFLRQIFLKDLQDSHQGKRENIYISRKYASRRRIANEEEVVNLLKKYGFRQVFLESMSVMEQASLLYHAKNIVSPHGAGLTNIIFSQPGTKLIEIFSPYYVNTVYWQISNHCRLDYYYLIGEDFDNQDDKKHGAKDILVDIDSLHSLLKIANLT